MIGALKPGFRRLATLKLVVSVVDELHQPKRRAAASRGFLATARLSCSVSRPIIVSRFFVALLVAVKSSGDGSLNRLKP